MYSSVEFNDIGPAVSKDDVTLFEAMLGQPLPESYRSFLLTINGGTPDPAIFPIIDAPFGTEGTVHHFFGLNLDNSDRDLAYNAEIYYGRLPAELLPIGTDPGGSLLCLSVGDEDYGVIYYWDQADASPEGVPPDDHNLYLVANDFYELLELLEDLDEEDELAGSGADGEESVA